MCNFCNKDKPKDWDNSIVRREFKNDSLSKEFEAIIIKDTLEFNYNAYSVDSSFNDEIKINFCPMCGSILNKK